MDAEGAEIGIEKKLEGARNLVSGGRYGEAQTLLENTIKKLEQSGEFVRGECFEFAGPIEQIIYIHRNSGSKMPVSAKEAVASLYTSYGKILMGMGESYKAREALDIALEYNPVSAVIMKEYADTYRLEGEMDLFFEETLKIFPFAYEADVLSCLYGNLGYYYVEKELWKEAMGCYLMSLHYNNKNEDAKKEIAYIQEKSGGDAGVPSIDEFRETAKEQGIPVGPDNEILGMAMSYGQKALNDGRKDVAHYFFSIAYNLTGDENIFNTLKDIEEELSPEA